MSFETTVHYPSVHMEEWKIIQPTAAQSKFVAMDNAWPIGIRIPTPEKLLTIDSLKQFELIGNAVLDTLYKHRPRFHKSKIGSDLIQASGTTIIITAYDKDDEVISATWDYGEPFDEAFTRLGQIRRTLRRVPVITATAYLNVDLKSLPPPQVVVSNVIPVGIVDPDTSLGGYASNFNMSPIIMATGKQITHIVFDHRLYTPKDEQIFADSFLEYINVNN